MRFVETEISGVFLVEAEAHSDMRGSFARLYCPVEFAQAGIEFTSMQVSLSSNPAVHTLRGMHFQDAPFAEAKLVRAVRGRAYDVALDLRPDSRTFTKWIGVEIDAKSMRGIFLPEGVAHGFLTLEPDTDILYQIGRPFEPGHARGMRWNDPAFAIEWPAEPKIISDADRTFPDFSD